MAENSDKHMHTQWKDAETKGRPEEIKERQRESEGETQQAWMFVVGNKVLLNVLLVPCIKVHSLIKEQQPADWPARLLDCRRTNLCEDIYTYTTA